MATKKKSKVKTHLLKMYFSIIGLLLVIAIISYPFFKEHSRRSSIKNDPKKIIKAIVTEEKVYDGNSPVSHSFSYRYKFEVDGKEYYGTSHDEELKPGDSIEIEFVIDHPENNARRGY